MLIRQAHPGPGVRPYASDADKLRDAERLQRDDAIPYPVLADDLPGTTHQTYGGLADPTYLLDADGRVAFYSMWTHAPTLHGAIERLVAQGGRGVVGDGVDRTPHLLSAFADGWHALRRGLLQSYTDLELSAPGMGAGLWAGYQLRPLLAPMALRARPLPTAARVGLALAAGVALALLVNRRRAESAA